MRRFRAYAFAVRITAWLSAGGGFIGAVIGVVLHVLVWRPSEPAGWWTFGGSRRYADYLAIDSGTRAAVRLRLSTTGGPQAEWWPLLPVTVGTGLITGALLGAAVLTFRYVRGRATTV